jgi:predicted ATPase/tetratricopeptide (TPR) repeat protein
VVVDLIGRESEVALVTARLRDRRVVTLVGPGGIGKTALARAALRHCEGDFGEGSRTVDLTRAATAAGVRESLAWQLGYTSYQAFLDAPGDRSVLILFDNCEHVIAAVSDAVEELLDVCQMPTVLATSTTALELPGEAVVPVGPLSLPPPGMADGPAVRLFVERARDAGAEVPTTERVGELCRRLDGVPLAIELAAARTRAMTPDEILARLGRGLDVLDRPRRRSAARHQSLRAAIAWSYGLLDADEQTVFDRLSVFTGPFTADDAHAVAGEPDTPSDRTEDVLDRLVAASMVAAEASGPTTWYRVLETLRAFGAARLDARGERRTTEARFADHVVARMVDIVESGAATWSADALGDLMALYDNVAAAVRWCVDHDDRPGRALLLVAGLWGVVHQAHTQEVGTLSEVVLDRWPDRDDPWWPDAAATAATCRYMLGDHAGAISLAESALDGAERSPFAPVTLRRAIAQARRADGDTDAAITWFDAAAAEARRLELSSLAAEADLARAQVLADVGDHDGALTLIGEVRADGATSRSDLSDAWCGVVEGSVLLRVDRERAEEVLRTAVEASRRAGYVAGIHTALRSLALAALAADDHRGAACRVLELLDEMLARGALYELRQVLDVASPLLAAVGRQGPAADLAATALALPVVSVTASVGHELFPLDPTGGRVLSARDAVLATRAEVGAVARADDEAAPARRTAATVDERVGAFRHVGEMWEVGLGGEFTHVRATKGIADIAALLASPGREVHCLELVGGGVDEAGTGEVLDATARRAYEQRVRDLQAALDEAEAANDHGRAERARVELDAVVDQLTAALGLGGRSRTGAGAAERARTTVTQRVRTAIRRLGDVDPRLGRHLEASIRTGTFCSYAPEDPVRWNL